MFMLPFLVASVSVQAEETGLIAAGDTAIAVNVIVNIDKESRAITLKDEESGNEWVFVAGHGLQVTVV